jgi:PAS domain S-box-containing protein
MSRTFQALNNQQLLNVLSLSKTATAVHIGETAIIQYANEAMLTIWGKGEGVIGKSLEEALPELAGQPFIAMFRKVWNEGLTISGTSTAAHLEIDGLLQTFYFDFEYRAVKNEKGKVICILHTATDVTARVIAEDREQALVEELRASNEELLAANEELHASNEELIVSQQSIKQLYEDLSESDARFRNMVLQAPVGICVIRSADLLIQVVNEAYLELVGRGRNELENLTIWDAIPEAAEVYAPLMNDVIETGKRFLANEHELQLLRKGIFETVFVDFVYEPILYNGSVEAIMVLAIEVTEKVIARRSTEEMEERIRLAVEAAEIGTFDLDLINETMLTSDRFNAIFGFDHEVSWEEFARAIHPDDTKLREKAYQDAYANGKLIYEARVLYQDGSVHWIRVHGKVYYSKEGKPERILGTLLDITNFKRLEQQKDDFISIASHELKTPITSLKASLQLMERIKDDPSPAVLPRLIEQSSKSMSKISDLVEKLLNVSRANESKLLLNKTTFVIADMLRACCSHIRLENRYQLIIVGDEQLQAFADEHAIDQVVANFITNAIKYASESTEILLIIEKLPGEVKIAVKDNGPGIAKDKLPHLFDRYYQAETAGFQSSGLGLGLFISAEIIRKHEGKIGVESELGNGSTFWFTLPDAIVV